MSHQNFLNAYLVSKGADPVDMEPFRTLQGSTATGSSGKLRLTNLMQLTIDTSWWTRYRSSTNNPDVNPTTFEQAVPDLHNGQFTAIPRTDDDLYPHEHIQAIANTAAFHIPTVEQGGGSLRMALAQRATSVEVLRLLISMGPIELMHFQTLSETAGNAPPLTDPTNGLTFPDLNCGVDPNTGIKRRCSQGDVPDQPDHAGTLPLHQHQPAGMFGSPSDEHDRGSHGSAQVSDGHGTLHWPVGCVLHVSDQSGHGCGRRTARSLATLPSRVGVRANTSRNSHGIHMLRHQHLIRAGLEKPWMLSLRRASHGASGPAIPGPHSSMRLAKQKSSSPRNKLDLQGHSIARNPIRFGEPSRSDAPQTETHSARRAYRATIKSRRLQP